MSCRLDYGPYVADSTVLDGQSGDILYWPHDYWHVGEAVDGHLSVAISVALFMHDDGGAGDLLARASRPVRRVLAQGTETVTVRPACVATSLPGMTRAVARATATLRSASEDRGLARALLAARLNHATGYGFALPPAPLPVRPLADDAVVRGVPEYPILWLRDGEDLVCSANGHAFTATASPHILSLLERLNGGEPYPVQDLVGAHAGTITADGVAYETSAETVRGLLEKLVTLRAIVSAA
jgi:hypothetical protein